MPVTGAFFTKQKILWVAVFRLNFNDSTTRDTPWITRNKYGVWHFSLNG